MFACCFRTHSYENCILPKAPIIVNIKGHPWFNISPDACKICNTVSSCFCLTSGKGITDSSANGDRSIVCRRASEPLKSWSSVDPRELDEIFLADTFRTSSFLVSILCCRPCLVRNVRASHPHLKRISKLCLVLLYREFLMNNRNFTLHLSLYTYLSHP